ncbi:MAG: acyl-ACP--UDP-N-acetylglucosamine O-acyltransferase [Candidatus Latescibacterota bacterium]
MTQVHDLAIVSSKAQLDEGVSVGPFSIVEDGVVIGADTQIASHVLVASGTTLGKECVLHHGAVVGTVPQDLKFRGEETTMEVGDRTVIREFATLNRGTEDQWKTVVGSDCLIMAYAHVAHDCVVGDHVILANSVALSGHVTIEDFAILGGFAKVHQFTRVGRHSFVGASFRVTMDVVPYIKVAGEPLKPLGLNTLGLKRRGFTPEGLAVLERAFRLLFRSGLNTSQALARMREELEPTEEVTSLIRFIEESARGIVR